ncbi:cytochrome P450 10-like [Styela clava]
MLFAGNSFGRRFLQACLHERRLQRLSSVSLLSCPVHTAHENTYMPKPFTEVVEPTKLPFIGSALDYTSAKGFELKYIHELWKKRSAECGELYKERAPGGEYIVYCSSPRDSEVMFRSDGRTPIRDALLNVKHARKKLGVPLGLMNLSGLEWYRIRSAVNPLMLQNDSVWKYMGSQFSVANDLVVYMKENLNRDFEVPDFNKVLVRWAFEMTGVFVFDTRLGLLSDKVDFTAKEIISSSLKMFQIVGETMYGLQLWKYFDTPKMKELCAAQQTQLEYTNHYYDKSMWSSNRKRSDEDKTLIEKILCCPKLSRAEKQMMASDLLLAGIDTTSNAAAFTLYCLTLNQDAQHKVRQEIFELLKKPEITGRLLENMTYMNAVIKETQRMFPFVTSHSRRASEDIILSGYHVPKGTNILNTSNAIHGRNPEFFNEPDSFMPERWMGPRTRDAKNRFVMTGSFGMGARKCLGRKFAQQELKMLLIAILSEFCVEYHHKPIRLAFKLTSYPSEKPQFTFIPLTK